MTFPEKNRFRGGAGEPAGQWRNTLFWKRTFSDTCSADRAGVVAYIGPPARGKPGLQRPACSRRGPHGGTLLGLHRPPCDLAMHAEVRSSWLPPASPPTSEHRADEEVRVHAVSGPASIAKGAAVRKYKFSWPMFCCGDRLARIPRRAATRQKAQYKDSFMPRLTGHMRWRRPPTSVSCHPPGVGTPADFPGPCESPCMNSSQKAFLAEASVLAPTLGMQRKVLKAGSVQIPRVTAAALLHSLQRLRHVTRLVHSSQQAACNSRFCHGVGESSSHDLHQDSTALGGFRHRAHRDLLHLPLNSKNSKTWPWQVVSSAGRGPSARAGAESLKMRLERLETAVALP
jgi:hypothetical protein